MFRKNLQSTWHANSGALNMAQVELDGSWPTNRWLGDSKVQQLHGAESQFQKALEFNRYNITALYRLGLIALARQDFDTAVSFLNKARQINPRHRGIQKALGYSALWSGDEAAAAKLLSTLPEAAYELGNYVNWWQQQGRPELSQRASALLETVQDH